MFDWARGRGLLRYISEWGGVNAFLGFLNKISVLRTFRGFEIFL